MTHTLTRWAYRVAVVLALIVALAVLSLAVGPVHWALTVAVVAGVLWLVATR